MLIDVEVAFACQREVKSTMPRKQIEHVIEEANARRDLVRPAPIYVEHQLDLRLRSIAFYRRFSHRVLSADVACCRNPIESSAAGNSFSSLSVCSSVPSVIRTHPAQPGSLLRSRTRMPRAR